MKPKNITYGQEAQQAIMRGAEKVYNVAVAAYGARAGNVLLEKTWGDPILSRDGVTNVREVFLKDPIENMAARVLVQASQKNNQTVGDGTSAVVILAYQILKHAQKQVAAGYNPMEVSRSIKAAAEEVVEQIDKVKRPIKDDMLAKVATISSGDEALGEMIADTLSEVGLDGGVTVEEYEGLGIHNEIVDGFHFAKGYNDLRLINKLSELRAEYKDISILITEKRMSTQVDIAPLLDKVVGQKIRDMLIIGDITSEAMELLILAKHHGMINTTVVDTPSFAGNRTLFLEDVAVMTGGKVYTGDVENFQVEDLGFADKALITEHTTTIVGGQGDKKALQARLDQLKEQLSDAHHPVTISALKDRISKLTGKIAVIRVGGATEIEQKEKKLRVDDAVCAVQAAIKDGIVPGGGTTLARIKGTYLDASLEEPFKQLIHNAGENAELRLGQLKKPWYGFNLLRMTEEPVDLYKEGIVDPAKVIKEVVINAASVASELITTAATITLEPEDATS